MFEKLILYKSILRHFAQLLTSSIMFKFPSKGHQCLREILNSWHCTAESEHGSNDMCPTSIFVCMRVINVLGSVNQTEPELTCISSRLLKEERSLVWRRRHRIRPFTSI